MAAARYIVGSYATSPSGLLGTPWAPEAERAFFAGLAEIEAVGGLELALFPDGAVHPHDEAFLLQLLTDHSAGARWDVVLTLIPGTMPKVGDNPHFGLASEDDAGRQAAVEFGQAAAAAVLRINTALEAGGGPGKVIAVEFHSAPTRGGVAEGSGERLKQSLLQLLQLDWGCAQLVLEHCDAYSSEVPFAPASKGFLSLADELAATELSSTQKAWLVSARKKPVGVTINWARSVLETRDPAAPVAHLQQAAAPPHRPLAGLMFSGCTDQADIGSYVAWTDSHMPHDGVLPGSMLTEAAVASCLAAVGGSGKLLYCGVKITAFHDATGKDVALRLAANRELLEVLQRGDAACC
jgi:hypothetical protein